MAIGDPKSVGEAFNKLVFNTKNPTKKRIIYMVLASFIVFLLGITANNYLGPKMVYGLDKILETAGLGKSEEFFISFEFNEEPFGDESNCDYFSLCDYSATECKETLNYLSNIRRSCPNIIVKTGGTSEVTDFKLFILAPNKTFLYEKEYGLYGGLQSRPFKLCVDHGLYIKPVNQWINTGSLFRGTISKSEFKNPLDGNITFSLDQTIIGSELIVYEKKEIGPKEIAAFSTYLIPYPEFNLKKGVYEFKNFSESISDTGFCWKATWKLDDDGVIRMQEAGNFNESEFCRDILPMYVNKYPNKNNECLDLY